MSVFFFQSEIQWNNKLITERTRLSLKLFKGYLWKPPKYVTDNSGENVSEPFIHLSVVV